MTQVPLLDINMCVTCKMQLMIWRNLIIKKPYRLL